MDKDDAYWDELSFRSELTRAELSAIVKSGIRTSLKPDVMPVSNNYRPVDRKNDVVFYISGHRSNGFTGTMLPYEIDITGHVISLVEQLRFINK